MPYCTVADVQAFTQPNPVYGASTNPTLTQVGTMIVFIEGEINVALITGGYSLPITDANGLLYLQATAMYGVASLAKQALQQQGDPEVSETVEDWWNKYTTRLLELKMGKVALGDTAKVSGQMRSLQTSHAVDGSEEGISDLTPWIGRDTDL
jgi:hypothetical protein